MAELDHQRSAANTLVNKMRLGGGGGRALPVLNGVNMFFIALHESVIFSFQSPYSRLKITSC